MTIAPELPQLDFPEPVVFDDPTDKNERVREFLQSSCCSPSREALLGYDHRAVLWDSMIAWALVGFLTGALAAGFLLS